MTDPHLTALRAAQDELVDAAHRVCYDGGSLDTLKRALARLQAAENEVVRGFMECRLQPPPKR